ncbi:ABC transporter permease [Candidatus Bathyarchaeota archaeon]|nr:ABC transporter permease [Candidatus Bathyarchaeota archaeon]
MPALILFSVFFLTPFVLMIRMSFFIGKPLHCYIEGFTIENYLRFLRDFYVHTRLMFTLQLSAPVIFLTLVLAYIMAYAISRSSGIKRLILICVTIFPIWINLVVIAFSWQVIFARYGLINFFLTNLGIIDKPTPLGYNFLSVVIGLVHVCLPYTILTLLSVLDNIDPTLEEAAKDLGATKFKIFVEVTLPMSMPGIITGAAFCFVWTMSSFVIPSFLGSPLQKTIGIEIANQVLTALNWPYGSVLSIVLLCITSSTLLISNILRERTARWAKQ